MLEYRRHQTLAEVFLRVRNDDSDVRRVAELVVASAHADDSETVGLK